MIDLNLVRLMLKREHDKNWGIIAQIQILESLHND